MEIQQIAAADWLDLLFDGRNKEYGAYDLRKNYNRRLVKSIAIMASVCLLFAGSCSLVGKLRGTDSIQQMVTPDIFLSDAVPEKKIDPLPIQKPLAAATAVATIRDVTTRIVPNDKVDPKDVPPAESEITDVKIGATTTAGPESGDIVTAPPGDGAAKGIVTAPHEPAGNDDIIFDRVEIESSYPGGIENWRRFLLKNFHPDKAIEEGIGGTVIVKFVVDKEGNVSDVEAISGPEPLRLEAVRVIKKSGKWSPAIQNGRMVKSYKRQPIILQLQEE